MGISHDHIVDTGVILFFPYTGFDCDFSLLLTCNKVKFSCLSSPFCEVSINTAMHLLESAGSLSQPYIYLNFFFFSLLIIPDLFGGSISGSSTSLWGLVLEESFSHLVLWADRAQRLESLQLLEQTPVTELWVTVCKPLPVSGAGLWAFWWIPVSFASGPLAVSSFQLLSLMLQGSCSSR